MKQNNIASRQERSLKLPCFNDFIIIFLNTFNAMVTSPFFWMKQNNIPSRQENQRSNEWHGLVFKIPCQRPYHEKRTWSRQLPAVKIRLVLLVPGRVTAWEYRMTLASIILYRFEARTKLETALF